MGEIVFVLLLCLLWSCSMLLFPPSIIEHLWKRRKTHKRFVKKPTIHTQPGEQSYGQCTLLLMTCVLDLTCKKRSLSLRKGQKVLPVKGFFLYKMPNHFSSRQGDPKSKEKRRNCQSQNGANKTFWLNLMQYSKPNMGQ